MGPPAGLLPAAQVLQGGQAEAQHGLVVLQTLTGGYGRPQRSRQVRLVYYLTRIYGFLHKTV